MKQRSPVVALILSLLVPFYIFYWLYDIARWMRQRGVRDVPSLVPMLVTLIVYLVLFIGLMMTVFISGDKAGSHATGAFLAVFIVAFVLVPIFWVLTVLYYYNFSKAVTTVVSLEMSPGLLTLIFVLIAAVPVYLIQEKLNQLPDGAAHLQA